jgi:LPS-assembly lipoprotein
MTLVRVALVVAVAGLCAACGFRPLYGNGGAGSRVLASIYVEPIEDSAAYELRNTLIDLLDSDGVQTGKTYRLALTYKRTSQGIALQNDAAITRYNDTLTVDYVLRDGKGAELIRGSESNLSAYNVVQSPYATLVAQRDADKRSSQEIAERIRIDLSLYFSRLK